LKKRAKWNNKNKPSSASFLISNTACAIRSLLKRLAPRNRRKRELAGLDREFQTLDFLLQLGAEGQIDAEMLGRAERRARRWALRYMESCLQGRTVPGVSESRLVPFLEEALYGHVRALLLPPLCVCYALTGL
jgi:hypothetical protein